MWFPNDEDGLVEVEQAELWELQDRWRHAEARCGRLEAKNRELKERFLAMRDELLLMATEREMMLDAKSGAS